MERTQTIVHHYLASYVLVASKYGDKLPLVVELPQQQLQLREVCSRRAIPILALKYSLQPYKPGTLRTYLNWFYLIPQAFDYLPQQHEAGLHLRLRLRDGCSTRGGVRARVWWQSWASVG